MIKTIWLPDNNEIMDEEVERAGSHGTLINVRFVDSQSGDELIEIDGEQLLVPNVGDEIGLGKHMLKGHIDDDEADEWETEARGRYEVLDISKSYHSVDAEIEDEDGDVHEEPLALILYIVTVESIDEEEGD